jgi:hypothetical protein
MCVKNQFVNVTALRRTPGQSDYILFESEDQSTTHTVVVQNQNSQSYQRLQQEWLEYEQCPTRCTEPVVAVGQGSANEWIMCSCHEDEGSCNLHGLTK